MLTDFQKRINVDAEYQRGQVWSKAQQALLIDSILRDFDIPKIFLRKRSDGSRQLFDVIDGKQRLTAIWSYIADNFALLRRSQPFPGLGDLSGKRWSALPESAQDRLQFANITISKIEDATADEIRELFVRLQRGETLNAAEKRNALSGPVRDFVACQLAAHQLWELTRLRSARFGRDEHSAIVLALMSEDGPTGLKSADLHQLYTMADFDPDGALAHATIAILDDLKQLADVKPGYIRTRWGLVDLLLVMVRLNRADLAVAPAELMSFFVSFEEERRSVASVLADLQTRFVEQTVEEGIPEDEPDVRAEIGEDVSPEMLSYHLAFSREGANRENVDTRSQIMYDKLLEFLGDGGKKVESR